MAFNWYSGYMDPKQSATGEYKCFYVFEYSVYGFDYYNSTLCNESMAER